MKILYLYSEIMGYSLATINRLVASGAEVHVVHWDRKGKLTSYSHPEVEGVYFYPRSEMTVNDISNLVSKLSPDITVVSGWMDKGYLKVVKKWRQKGGIVVACLDGQWHGSLRQWFAKFLGFIHYFSRYFSHAWVAGSYQYEYARILGFQKHQIIFDFYSADIEVFRKSYLSSVKERNKNYPHVFLFVGRLEEVKGIRTLIETWKSLGSDRLDWELRIIGSGTLEHCFDGVEGVVVKPFMSAENLMLEAQQSGCFILPSLFEPWGVVAHEFCAAGLPLILSSAVGASNSFLINGFNGYQSKKGDNLSLMSAMVRIINKADEDLALMGSRSFDLALKITPNTSAANLISVLDN